MNYYNLIKCSPYYPYVTKCKGTVKMGVLNIVVDFHTFYYYWADGNH